MNEAAILSHALTTALYAAQKGGCDLEKLLQHASEGIIGNSLRPQPQHQEAVIKAIRLAINDIKDS